MGAKNKKFFIATFLYRNQIFLLLCQPRGGGCDAFVDEGRHQRYPVDKDGLLSDRLGSCIATLCLSPVRPCRPVADKQRSS